MSVKCVYCLKETSAPLLCSGCSNFICDKCAITKSNVNYCVKCFLEKCTVAERKMWTKLLVEKGVIKEDLSAILSYQGNPIVEFSYSRVDDKIQYTIRCNANGAVQYNRVQSEFFKKMWEKAVRMGFKPERIPFGERIKIARK
ncbi:MAG: hypothetical protein V1731_00890 [Candidatus Aenigmatarchaeota archaeon]